MPSPAESQRVSALVKRLERWIEKRKARQLDSRELHDAVQFLRDYVVVLAASEALQAINTSIRNGNSNGSLKE